MPMIQFDLRLKSFIPIYREASFEGALAIFSAFTCGFQIPHVIVFLQLSVMEENRGRTLPKETISPLLLLLQLPYIESFPQIISCNLYSSILCF